ncbi:hypothetical protein SBBP2_2400012 [Burkholderiales bacterium]|nr:hypothetical protein SBBP2_2400012 [Burkholderiales bacterium]
MVIFDRNIYGVRANPYAMPIFFIGTPARRLKLSTVHRAPFAAIEDSRFGPHHRCRQPESRMLFHD